MRADLNLRLRRLGDRLVTSAAGKSPLADPGRAGECFATAVLSAAPPPQVMEQTGVAGPLARAVVLAAPADLPGALEGIATALSRFHARRRALRGAALYAMVLAVATTLLASIVFLRVVPALSVVTHAQRGGEGPSALGWPALVAVVVTLGWLLYLAYALTSTEPRFPFREASLTQVRALLLSVAGAFVRHLVPLPVSLRAAAALSPSRSVGQAAEAVAAALDRGGSGHEGDLLFGELGASLFAGAAGEGQGATALESLADLHEAAAQQELPSLLWRAELLSTLVAGAAIALAAISFMVAYATSLNRW